MPLDEEQSEEFVRLITQYHMRIYLFILSLLPNRADADEVMQETNLVLWRRFEEFRPQSDFRAWAFQVAYFKVQKHLEQQQRSRVAFGKAFLDKVASVVMTRADDGDARQAALFDCIGELSEKDQRLIEARYRAGATTAGVAQEVGRSTEAVYKAVQRIRRALRDCVQHKLATGEC